MSPIFEIAAPIALLATLGGFFLSLARQAATADKEHQRRARALSHSAREAVVGAVGWRAANLLSSDVDCGMVSRKVDGKTIIARQAGLSRDSISAL